MRRLLVLALVVGVVVAMAVAAGAAPLPKVDVCHFDADTGTFHLINISENAFDSHVAHGDGSPLENVPGMPGYGFDENCVPTALVTICQLAAGGGYVPVSVLPSEAIGQPKPGDPVPGISGYRFDESCAATLAVDLRQRLTPGDTFGSGSVFGWAFLEADGGMLVVDAFLDGAAASQTLTVWVVINGAWHQADLGTLVTDAAGDGSAHLELTLSEYFPGGPTVRVVVDNWYPGSTPTPYIGYASSLVAVP